MQFQIEENAKKQVDKAAAGLSSAAACIQLYNKWVEKLNNPKEAVADTKEEPKQKSPMKKQPTKDDNVSK